MSDLKNTIVRPLLQCAEDIGEATGSRPLIQIAVSPAVFHALAVEMGGQPEPGEPDEMRISGGMSVATFDAVALRDGWSDMLTGTGTLKRARDERAALRAALAEANKQRAQLAAWKEVMSDALAKIRQAARGDATPEKLAQIRSLADMEGAALARLAEMRAKFLGGGK